MGERTNGRVVLTPSEAKCRCVSSDLCTSTRSTADFLHALHSASRCCCCCYCCGHRSAASCPVVDIRRRSGGTHARPARRALPGLFPLGTLAARRLSEITARSPPIIHVTRHQDIRALDGREDAAVSSTFRPSSINRERTGHLSAEKGGRISRVMGSRACRVTTEGGKKKVKEARLRRVDGNARTRGRREDTGGERR